MLSWVSQFERYRQYAECVLLEAQRLLTVIPSLCWGLLALLALSLLLLSAGLWRFNMLLFDELSYARYAHNDLRQLLVLDGHAPLGSAHQYRPVAGRWFWSWRGTGRADSSRLVVTEIKVLGRERGKTQNVARNREGYPPCHWLLANCATRPNLANTLTATGCIWN